MEKCDEKILWLDYKNITKVVQVGSHVYVDDGLITLTVKEVGEQTELCLSSVSLVLTLGDISLVCVSRRRLLVVHHRQRRHAGQQERRQPAWSCRRPAGCV